MESDNVDIKQMEKQRYEAIKKSGKYIELNILIGTEFETINNKEAKVPVVSTKLHQCSGEEIACLYATLKSYIENLEKEYPLECVLAKLTLLNSKAKTIKNPLPELDNENQKEKEN